MQRGLVMRDWASKVLLDAIKKEGAKIAPVQRRRIETLETLATDANERKPFWKTEDQS
jgi:hypothetical protein